MLKRIAIFQFDQTQHANLLYSREVSIMLAVKERISSLCFATFYLSQVAFALFWDL